MIIITPLHASVRSPNVQSKSKLKNPNMLQKYRKIQLFKNSSVYRAEFFIQSNNLDEFSIELLYSFVWIKTLNIHGLNIVFLLLLVKNIVYVYTRKNQFEIWWKRIHPTAPVHLFIAQS